MENKNLLNQMVIVNDGFQEKLGIIKGENINEWVNEWIIKIKDESDITHAKHNVKEDDGLGIGVKLASKKDLELMLLRSW